MDKFFDIADEVIEKVYPDTANKGKGWWGENRIPNWGILRGAIAEALASQPIAPADSQQSSTVNGVDVPVVEFCNECGSPVGCL